MDILRTEKALAAGTGRVLVFVGSKRGADRLRADLAQRVGASSAVVAIHGDLDQARAPLPLPLPLPPLAREGS